MLLMNNRLLKTIGLAAVLLALGLSLLTGCQDQKRETSPQTAGTSPGSTAQATGNPDGELGVLTITGTGVKRETRFTLSQLKGMEDALAEACYSTVNNWPTKKFLVGRGVRVSRLLEKAGIKDDAQGIVVRAADGYRAAFTREQLEEKRFYFPNLLEGMTEEAREVPALLAWEHQEDTSDLSKAVGGKLRLILGQKGLNDMVAAACVKDVTTIEVLTEPPGQWDEVRAEPAPGKVQRGAGILLSHPQQDLVKIYYTLDGSTPDAHSPVYNPSATYFQPDLNKPIPVDQPVTVKAVVIGFGKHDSRVAAFAYDVE